LHRQLRKPNLLSFEMGGTMAKASLIKGDVVEMTSEYEVGGDDVVNCWMHGADQYPGGCVSVKGAKRDLQG
jgi:N-methylhydantoinase A/oxoprolinase/acetone carboxylase beta subunit